MAAFLHEFFGTFCCSYDLAKLRENNGQWRKSSQSYAAKFQRKSW